MSKRTAHPLKPARSLAVALAIGQILGQSAQAQATGESGAAPLVLDEIIVTAQKRAESLQNVPVSVTAVSAESLEKLGVQSFADLTRVSPSLTIAESTNRNENPVSLRGIGTLSFSIGIEPSVAVVIDDVPVPKAGGFFSNLSDVERIEVLRGPQSTLFGKNASAGVINIVTQDPSTSFEGSVEAGITSDNEYRLLGSLSGPVGDTAGLRVSAYYSDREGHLKNLTDGRSLDGGTNYGARAKLRVNPDGPLDMTFIAEVNESQESTGALPFRSITPNAVLFGSIPASTFLAGITPSTENNVVRRDGPSVSDSSDWMLSARFDYELGDHTLTSVTGYREWNYDWQLDADQTGAFTLNQGGPYATEQLTQEVRLTSPASNTLEYVVGLYYTDMDNARSFERGPTVARAKWTATAGSESVAVFGQAKWGLGEKFDLITGLRYNHEKYNATFRNQISGTAFAPNDSDDVVLGKLSLQYRPTDDVMVFGSFARGYKAGGYDISTSFNQVAADNPVGAESSDAFELGLKSTLADGRVQLNVTSFRTDFKDFQAQSTVFNTTSGAFDFRLNNVGELRTQGVEIDAVALATEGLKFGFGAAYVDATISTFRNADCFVRQTVAQGCAPIDPANPASRKVQDLSGKRLNNAPEWKFGLTGEYTVRTEGSFDGFADIAYQWQDAVNFDLLGNPFTEQGAYGVLNLSAGINAKDESYRVTLFVNNLLDQSYVTAISDTSSFFAAADRVILHRLPRQAERYFGLRVKWNF